MAVFTGLIASVTTWFAGLSTVGAFLVKTVASMGLSMLAQKLSGKKKAQSRDLSVQGQIGRGADLPQAFITGIYATAGTLTYANTATIDASPNVRMYWVITLSDLPVMDVTGIWVNGKSRTITRPAAPDGWFVIDDFTKDGGEHLRFKFYDGTQTAADADVIAEASSAERPWDASAIGKGRAYVVMCAHLKDDLFQNGFPSFLFEVKGIPLYNPAGDSTVGGSGSNRWNDQSTWFAYDNPAIILYNILRGIRYNGEWFYGLQDVSEAQLPVAHWIAQINKCATMITGASGPEQQFRASGEIPVGATIATVVESLLDACNGRLSDAGGVYKLFCGEPDAPVMTLTDDEILSTADQSFTPFFGLADTVNGVSGKYPQPAAGWQTETAPPIYNPDYEAEDGGRRLLVDVSFDMVPFAEQVQRLMSSALNEARRARRHTLTLPPKFWPLEPGDVIAWTSERNGYISKQFRVDGMIDLGNADVVLDVTEVDQSDYDWNSATDFKPGAITDGAVQPIPIQQVQGFGVEPASVRDAAYISRMPAIRAFWNPDVPDVRAITMELRVTATQEAIDPATSESPRDGEVFISTGILPNTSYEVRAKFLPIADRPVEWTIWYEVTTWDIKIEPDYISDLVWDKIEEDALGWADKLLRDDPWLAEITQNALNDLDTLLTSYEGRKLIKQDLAIAEQTFETELIANQSAMATIKTNLEAQIGTSIATINATLLVQATQISANSSDITTIYGQVVDIQGDLIGQAGAISSLTTDVSAAGGMLSVQAGQIDSLISRITSAEGVNTGQATAISGLTTNVTSIAGTVSSQAGSITSLSTTVGGHTTSISQNLTSINGIKGEYTLKINNNGVVTGFSLRSSASEGSEVAFMADRFAITNGPDQTQRKAPFIVYTSPTTVDGTPVAAGVYMRDAFIRDASVTTLRIKGSAVTVPAVDTDTTNIPGIGLAFADWVTVSETLIVLDFPGYVLINWTGQHGYAGAIYSDAFPHSFRFVLNFETVFERAADAINDYPSASWMGYRNAGSYVVKVQWRGAAPIGSRTITLNSRTLSVLGVKR